VIRHYYSNAQEDLLMNISERDQPLVVGGDGRHDSVGKCAVYCTYSVQDVASRKILHTEQVHVSLIHLEYGVYRELMNF
jgi:hypothetical protein